MPTSTPRRWARVALMMAALATTGCALFTRQAAPDPDEAPHTPSRAAELWRMPADAPEAAEALASRLALATAQGRSVAIAGARQSLGGQSFVPGGVVIDMRAYRAMALEPASRTLVVRAGARWAEVLGFLQARGYSPEVMQGYNDFTIGGSLASNCHGAQGDAAPIASTVKGFTMMLADGRVVHASRSERSELFRHAIGGYGLFGVLLDVELRVVPNERYRVQRFFVRPEDAARAFDAHVAHGSGVGLAELTWSVAPGSFLREGILTVHTRAGGKASTAALPAEAPEVAIQRRYLRDAVGSNGGKVAMWEAVKRADTGLREDFSTRNALLNRNAESLWKLESGGTIVRQEYLLPRTMVASFLEHLRASMPGNRVDLLEASMTAVKPDDTSVLRYAERPMFALALTFHQARSDDAERAMAGLSRELIDAALVMHGRHALPGRLSATPEQFRQAYPQASGFFAVKRRYDPKALFQNQLFAAYGK